MTRPVLIAAGGTGGHMFPALSLAAELQARGRRVVVVCDQRGARYLAPGIEHHLIQAASPSGSLARRLGAAGRLAWGFVQSAALIARLRPVALAAFGGYGALPPALAAAMLRVPLLVHEQNAILGRANRILARRAARVALTFAETAHAAGLPADRVVVTGNPVRAEVAALADRPFAAPGPGDVVRVLVVGGSQGARILSDVVPAALALLAPEERARIDLVQQCRPEDLERVQRAYDAQGLRAELRSFFEDLPERLAGAHLVISRSGASSAAEILVLGRPALFVPYRYAADDHQRANADAIARAGAAWVLSEDAFNPQALAGKLRTLLTRPDELTRMAECARALGRADAARALADALEPLVRLADGELSKEALA